MKRIKYLIVFLLPPKIYCCKVRYITIILSTLDVTMRIRYGITVIFDGKVHKKKKMKS